eukprot:m.137276 g.137276  ORF g.137276 m.137276 type:complete len:621 (+) comp38217_c0_seq12:40-1902(+)
MKTKSSKNNQKVEKTAKVDDTGERIRTKVSQWENVLLICGLVVTLILTAMPLFFYIWDPPLEDVGKVTDYSQRNASDNCSFASGADCRVLNSSLLATSVCSRTLNWDKAGSRKEMVSISGGCNNWDRAEDDLRVILAAIAVQASPACKDKAIPLLCRSVYEKCGKSTAKISREECAAVRDKYCPEEWKLAQQIQLPLSCFQFPECDCFIPTNSTKSFSTFSSFSNVSAEINITCPWPSIPSSSRYALGGCSPRCLSDQWTKPGERDAIVTFMFIGILVTLGGCVVVIITWIKVKELRSFPQIITLCMIVAYSIPFVTYLLPLLMGRKRAFCSHDDAYSVWEDPTPLCKAQGFVGHFGFICSLTWWLCSIFNIFICLFSGNRPNPVRHHPRLLMTVETALALGLPAVLTTIVLTSKEGYGSFSVEIILCAPASLDLLYLTFALPLQIITWLGSAMVIYLLKVTRQRFTGQLSSIKSQKRKSHLASRQEALRKRFILLVVCLPLCFSITMTAYGVFSKLAEPMARDYHTYLVCLRQGGGDNCKAKHQEHGEMEIAIFNLATFVFFSFALIAYALSPQLATNYWKEKICNVDISGWCSCERGEYDASRGGGKSSSTSTATSII